MDALSVWDAAELTTTSVAGRFKRSKPTLLPCEQSFVQAGPTVELGHIGKRPHSY